MIDAETLKYTNASSGSVDDLLRNTPFATTSKGPRSSGEAVQIRGLDDDKIFVVGLEFLGGLLTVSSETTNDGMLL